MSGVNIDVDVIGLERTERVLARLREAGQDLSPILRDIGEHLLNATKDRFAGETAPDGTPWAPLEPGYAADKTTCCMDSSHMSSLATN